jgi:hypothetical protein
MNPFKQKSPVATALRKKGVTTVGELKERVKFLEDMNLQLEGMMKAEGPENPDYSSLGKIEGNKEAIARYKKIIANPSKYKPKSVVKAAVDKAFNKTFNK